MLDRISADGSLALIVFSAGIFVGAFVASGVWLFLFRRQETRFTRWHQETPQEYPHLYDRFSIPPVPPIPAISQSDGYAEESYE